MFTVSFLDLHLSLLFHHYIKLLQQQIKQYAFFNLSSSDKIEAITSSFGPLLDSDKFWVKELDANVLVVPLGSTFQPKCKIKSMKHFPKLQNFESERRLD